MDAGSDEVRWRWLRLRRESSGVGILTLDRPQLNLMDLEMRGDLFDALQQARSDADIRALIVTGAGGAFSAGGDVNDFVDSSPESLHSLMREKSHRWFRSLWELPMPTIAVVDGVAAGGGVNLALACDFVLASPRARFGQTFMTVGLIPDLGGLAMLPRSVGLHRAKAMCLSGELVDAERGKDMGFVHDVVPSERLMDSALDLARRLAEGPADAFTAIKTVLNRSFESSMDEVLQLELYAQSYLFSTSEHNRRLGRFLDGGRDDAGST